MPWGQNYIVSTDWQEILPPKMTKNQQKIKKIPNCKQEITKINVESNGNAKVNIII